jgi:hypothetical protein
MSKYDVGDLVWIPDGTPNYTKIDKSIPKYRSCLPVKGPACGLVLNTSCLDGLAPAGKHWLSIQITDKIFIIHEKDVRKIDNGRTVHDQTNRSYTDI